MSDINLNDPNDESAEECAITGFPLTDEERHPEYPGIRKDQNIGDYRTPAQQVSDSYELGQKKQCREFLDDLGLKEFIKAELIRDEVGFGPFIATLRFYVSD